MVKNFTEISAIDIAELRMIFKTSYYFKKSRTGLFMGAIDPKPTLSDRVVALLFTKPSTRTRFSFEVGINQMGGKTISVSGNDMQLSNAEKMCDTAQVLSKFVDMIVLRTDNHHDLLELVENSEVPVINGLTDFSHPCQVLSDIFTYEEIAGPIKGKKVVWLGDGNNVCSSYLQSADKFDFELVYSGPKVCEPKNIAETRNCAFEKDPEIAVKGANILITDTWFSMHQTELERAERSRVMDAYCITKDLVRAAKSNCLVFHCMPLYREKEISSEVAKNFFKVFIAQAENRLHVQKAIVKWCFS